MELWYSLVDLLPFEWAVPGEMLFIKNALLAVIIISPLFAILSTMIVSNSMSFFSDALGHGAFTGLVIGSLSGIIQPLWCALLFSIAFSVLVSYVKNNTRLGNDTVIGVFSSVSVALGILLSTMGGRSFSKLNTYLIGDILSISAGEIVALAVILIGVLIYWCFSVNKLTLLSINRSVARSRRIRVLSTEMVFSAVIAVVVTLSISWVGLLVINSLLVLPAAIARNVSANMRQYSLIAIISAFTASIGGLLLSYYIGSSSGAAMVLILSGYFAISLIISKKKHR